MSATETYRILVKRDAWDHNDPIPWAYAVLDGSVVVHSGWAGTDDEAREFAQEWLDAYRAGTLDKSA